VDALALRHTAVHHCCDVAEDGLHVGVADCGDLRKVFGYGLCFHWLALHYRLRIVHILRLAELLFIKRHDYLVFNVLQIYFIH